MGKDQAAFRGRHFPEGFLKLKEKQTEPIKQGGHTMKKIVAVFFVFFLVILIVPAVNAAEDDYMPYLDEKYGKILLNMRWRYEKVDQDGVNNADAVTIRTRLGYQTPTFFGFTGLVEMENTIPFNSGTYKVPGVTSPSSSAWDRAVIVDPRNTELNRAQLSYTGLSDTSFILGRQRIILDNWRFIGNVGWRQNEQTFDSVTLKNTSIKGLEFYYGYLDRVNRIFGKESHPKEHPATGYYWDMDSHIINIAYTPCPYAKLVGYAYLLKIESSQANSSDTYGAYLGGEYPVGDIKLNYRAEYATQDDNNESPSSGALSSFDLDYYHIKVGAKCERTKLNVGIGYEVLEGNGDRGFRTPLATVHAFQGWADKFLTTPENGIEDLYAWAGIKLPKNIMLKAVYHQFEAENNGSNYGDEIDCLAVWKIDKHFKLLGKYANYSEDGLFTDTKKYIMEINIRY